jgi:hypothetical protein
MRAARRASIALCLAGVLLAACETPAPRGGASGAASGPARVIIQSPVHTTADELSAYLAKLRGMSESALAAEAARQKRAMARDTSDLQRLRAAIALALSAQGEDAEVTALAEPIARREGADANARAMANFLLLFAAERRRLRESAVAARMSLREEKRATETQKQRADALQERAAQLQQKLDALSELEKSLTDRPPPAQ